MTLRNAYRITVYYASHVCRMNDLGIRMDLPVCLCVVNALAAKTRNFSSSQEKQRRLSICADSVRNTLRCSPGRPEIKFSIRLPACPISREDVFKGIWVGIDKVGTIHLSQQSSHLAMRFWKYGQACDVTLCAPYMRPETTRTTR
jgi:hypothetical protein